MMSPKKRSKSPKMAAMNQSSTQLDPKELAALLKNLDNIPEAHLQDIYKTLAEFEHVDAKEGAENDFMKFVEKVWPSFIRADTIKEWHVPLSAWRGGSVNG